MKKLYLISIHWIIILYQSESFEFTDALLPDTGRSCSKLSIVYIDMGSNCFFIIIENPNEGNLLPLKLFFYAITIFIIQSKNVEPFIKQEKGHNTSFMQSINMCGDEKIYYKSIPKLSVSLVMGQFGVKEGNGFRKIIGKIGRK